MTWEFTLTGLLIGALVGLTGMGGGSLLTPILVILFGFKPTLAVGTDVLHGAVFKTFGAVRHRRLGTVHARLTAWMFLGLMMVLVFPLTIPKIVGTDIFHAAALLWVAGFGHLVAGNVDLHAMAWLLSGSVPGVLLGSQLTLRVPERALRLALASVLMLSGIKLIDFPGADWVIAGGAIAAGLGISAWALVTRPAR